MAAQTQSHCGDKSHSLLKFDAELTPWQIAQREPNDDYRKHKLLALSTLTQSGDQLLAGFRAHGGGDALCGAVQMLDAYQAHLKDMLEVCDLASVRLYAVATVMLDNEQGEA